MKTAYAQAMGLGERKPKNQLAPESKNDKDFWEGFRKGLGLKDGEEIGQEGVVNKGGGMTEMVNGGSKPGLHAPVGRPGLSAQDGMMHRPGLNGIAPPLQNPDGPGSEDRKLDRGDYASDREYWDAVGEALSGYVESGDTRGAAGFMLENRFDLREMNRRLPGMADQVSEMMSRETMPETYFVSPETVQLSPVEYDDVYVSEEDYFKFLDEVAGEDGPLFNSVPVDRLIENRQLSKQVEEMRSYAAEEDAAVAFAETAVLETGKDNKERGAVIYIESVPVVDELGRITMEDRYILGPTFVGDHDHVVVGLLSTYAENLGRVLSGTRISFVHTHPYCTGHVRNEFSGLEGDTVSDIVDEFMRRVLNNEDFKDFGRFLGDQQVPWLPGVDRIYLASPDLQQLYACDSNGPVMDPNNPNKYMVVDTFAAKNTGTPYPY